MTTGPELAVRGQRIAARRPASGRRNGLPVGTRDIDQGRVRLCRHLPAKRTDWPATQRCSTPASLSCVGFSTAATWRSPRYPGAHWWPRCSTSQVRRDPWTTRSGGGRRLTHSSARSRRSGQASAYSRVSRSGTAWGRWRPHRQPASSTWSTACASPRPWMRPGRPIDDLATGSPSLTLVDGSSGDLVGSEEVLDAAHWHRQATNQTQAAGRCAETLAAADVGVVVVLGPNAVVSGNFGIRMAQCDWRRHRSDSAVLGLNGWMAASRAAVSWRPLRMPTRQGSHCLSRDSSRARPAAGSHCPSIRSSASATGSRRGAGRPRTARVSYSKGTGRASETKRAFVQLEESQSSRRQDDGPACPVGSRGTVADFDPNSRLHGGAGSQQHADHILVAHLLRPSHRSRPRRCIGFERGRHHGRASTPPFPCAPSGKPNRTACCREDSPGCPSGCPHRAAWWRSASARRR